MPEVHEVRCIECREIINEQARVCLKCKSPQDWRRHLSFSSTVLSLLVALVSVSSLAIPAIVSALTPNRSHIRVAVVRWRNHASVQNYLEDRKFDFQLYVSNVGSRRGAIGRVQMRPTGDEQAPWEELDVTPHYAGSATELIEPGTAHFLFYSRTSLFSPTRKQPAPLPSRVELEIEILSDDGTSQPHRFTYPTK
jgi:hypothetical protein